MLAWIAERMLGSEVALFGYITFRTIMAALTAMAVSLLIGPYFIRRLLELKLGQPIRAEGPEGHMGKAGTPTMGGTLIILAVAVATVLWSDPGNRYVWTVLFVTLAFGAVGFIDDYRKLARRDSRGLPARWKYTLQSLAALGAAVFLFNSADVPAATELIVPFFKTVAVPLGAFYILTTYFVVVGASNAVNLTDGLDGLAAGTSAIAGLILGIFAYVSGRTDFSDFLNIIYLPGAGELTIFCASLVGACMGFLWYNTHPASVFMGDTGSLALGGSFGALALMLHKELLLPIICGIFFVETVSVIIQTTYFKYTKRRYGEGKRVFLMTPIHHHFEKKGLPESKIVVRFWIIAVLLGILSLLTLKLR